MFTTGIMLLAFVALLFGYFVPEIRDAIRRNWRGTTYPLAKCDKPGDVLRNGAAICKGCRSGFYGPVTLQEIAPKLEHLTEESDIDEAIRRWR